MHSSTQSAHTSLRLRAPSASSLFPNDLQCVYLYTSLRLCSVGGGSPANPQNILHTHLRTPNHRSACLHVQSTRGGVEVIVHCYTFPSVVRLLHLSSHPSSAHRRIFCDGTPRSVVVPSCTPSRCAHALGRPTPAHRKSPRRCTPTRPCRQN